ncbi:MAG TPA: hypothetical protein VFH61_17225 [Thermoleophilia bacterium]|nr:hypothetical protein [Thermoleophilia bacterium]
MEMECKGCGWTVYYAENGRRYWHSPRDTCTCDLGRELPLSAVESLGKLAE